MPFSCQKKGPDRVGNGDKTSPFVSSWRYIPLEFMASKDDDSTPISSPITGPPQHETAMGSVQSPTPPLIYPLSSPTPSYSIRIEPPSVAPPSIPLPWVQNPDFIEVTEQKQQSSWSSWYPSIPYALRRSPDLNHQEVPSPITPFISPRSLPDTPADNAGENENRNPSPTRGPANFNRHRSRDPSMGPSFDTSNYRTGVSAGYHNSGWGSSTPNYPALGPPANDQIPTFRKKGKKGNQGNPTSYAAAPWPPANYYAGLSPRANDRMLRSGAGTVSGSDRVLNAGGTSAAASPYGIATRVNEAVASTLPITSPTSTRPTTNIPPANDYDRMPPSGAGTVLGFDGVLNAGAISAAASPYGIATRVNEAVASTLPITNPTLSHSSLHSSSMHPITSPTSTRPTTNFPPANDHDRMPPSGAGTVLGFDGVLNAGAISAAASPYGVATRVNEAVASTLPITSPTSTHSAIHPSSMHPTTSPTSMHPTTNPTSTHAIINTSWDVHVYSQTLQIKGERLRRYQIVRSKLRFESQLNDLFSGSLGVWHQFFFSEEITGLTVHTYLISPDNSATPTP